MEQISVPFFRHNMSGADAASVANVMNSPFLTTGAVARRTQDILCTYFDVGHAKLSNSWTNGAVATLLAMNIGPGDEVIVPAMTFIATSNVVELAGATPIFVDVNPGDLLIDLDAVAAAITPRTRAVIPVHLYGQMVDIAALRERIGPSISIIEDAAHCFEGTLNGARPGQHSDAAIFSFYATKNVTCGEGGAIITRSEELARTLDQTTLHGMSAGADKRFSGNLYRHWDMERLGTKANLPDLLAALLPAQIETVDERRAERERLANRYRAAFSNRPMVRLVNQIAGAISAEHLFPIGVPRGQRDLILRKINDAKIGTTVNYRAVHRTKFYSEKYGFKADDFMHSSEWGECTLSLPLFPGLRSDEQEYVIENVMRVLEDVCE
jgi:UDP-4-amino-4-deoxy-L-arabinose-oxoglutarate aminotransferase